MLDCGLVAGLTYEGVCSFEPPIFDEDDMEWCRGGPPPGLKPKKKERPGSRSLVLISQTHLYQSAYWPSTVLVNRDIVFQPLSLHKEMSYSAGENGRFTKFIQSLFRAREPLMLTSRCLEMSLLTNSWGHFFFYININTPQIRRLITVTLRCWNTWTYSCAILSF